MQTLVKLTASGFYPADEQMSVRILLLSTVEALLRRNLSPDGVARRFAAYPTV